MQDSLSDRERVLDLPLLLGEGRLFSSLSLWERAAPPPPSPFGRGLG